MSTPRFTGIIPPMVTPLRGPDELDHPGLERLVAHLVAGGVHGLFIMGTTGEGPHLSYRLRRELTARTCLLAAGRVPVLVGITDSSMVEAVALAHFAAESGAQAVVAAPPFYVPPGQPELVAWATELAAQVPLPLMLYNMPALTKVVLEPETVRQTMALPNVAGLKDSGGDLNYYRQVLALLPQRPDWSILLGPEEMLLEANLAGGHGGVAGGANIFPKLYVALQEASTSGDHARAEHLQELVRQVAGHLYGVGRHASRIIKGIKCALALRGVCDDFMTPPFQRFDAPEREQIAAALGRLEPLLRQEHLERSSL